MNTVMSLCERISTVTTLQDTLKFGWVVPLVWRWLISPFVCILSSHAIKIITRQHAKGQGCHNCLEDNNTYIGCQPGSNALPMLMVTLWSVVPHCQQDTNFETGCLIGSVVPERGWLFTSDFFHQCGGIQIIWRSFWRVGNIISKSCSVFRCYCQIGHRQLGIWQM
jgi:hypothetical protein